MAEAEAPRYTAFGFLYHAASGRVLLHRRGPDAAVYPDRWSFFGGKAEPEDAGDPVGTWRREMREELGVDVPAGGVRPVRDYPSTAGSHRYVFYAEWPDAGEEFVLGEGVGFRWFAVDEVLARPDMSDN